MNAISDRPLARRRSSVIRSTCASSNTDSSNTGYSAILSISAASFCTASACADIDRNSGSANLADNRHARSEEHTSELQSRGHLVCRLLLEKKKKTQHE